LTRGLSDRLLELFREVTEIRERNYAIDHVRIAAMFFIVLGHFLIFRESGLEAASFGNTPIHSDGDYIGLILLGFAIIGTNLFFLITGYFGSKLKLSKILSLILITYFWGGIVQAILLASGRITLTILVHTLIRLLDRYWFMEVYLVLVLASPLLNAFLKSTTLKQKITLVIVWFLVLCVYGFAHDCTRIGVANGFSFVWAAFMYVVGNVIREIIEQVPAKIERRARARWIYAASTAVYIAVCFFLTKTNRYTTMWRFAVSYNNPLVVFASVSFFFLFAAKKDAKGNRFIRFLSGTTIGVYLIHTAPNLDIFRFFKLRTDTIPVSLLFVAEILLGSALIYLTCALLDTIRQHTIHPPVNRLLQKLEERITGLVHKQD